jgi:4-diphosphocytidyl-2-C-methyl-D-erythritol kinase
LQACSTVDVFRTMGLKPGDLFGEALDLATPNQWRNDMTRAACSVLPVIADVLQALESLPQANVVRMSGSGATCFALFSNRASADNASLTLQAKHPHWWIRAADLN